MCLPTFADDYLQSETSPFKQIIPLHYGNIHKHTPHTHVCEFNTKVKNQMTVTSGLPDAGWSVNHITHHTHTHTHK